MLLTFLDQCECLARLTTIFFLPTVPVNQNAVGEIKLKLELNR